MKQSQHSILVNDVSADTDYKTEKIRKVVDEPDYQLRGQMVLSILTTRLEQIDCTLSDKYGREVINQISGRMKTADSIYRKLLKKKCPTDPDSIWNLNDLVGIRAVCLFVDDVYAVAKKIKEQTDIQLVKEKDYIAKPKKNGYQSLHLIVEVSASDLECFSCKPVRVEIQLRTVAMDSWSVLDHQLLYKKNIKGSASVAKELKDYSRFIQKLDKRMLKMRKKIEKLHDS